MTIERLNCGRGEFQHWRKSIHNLLAYRRDQCRWWQSFGLWLWSNGNRLNGLVEFGSITNEEFVAAFQRHGMVGLRPIEITDVRVEVYKAVWSIALVEMEAQKGRYQPLKIAIEPVTVAVSTMPIVGNIMIEPQPVVL
ncbi:hypothetical protein ACXIUS_29400 [Bosea thiooxidans]|nr:hypothetical protein [Bosea sp. (in: a-proteobacteria)]